MKLEYTVKKEDENKILKHILKKDMYISNVLLNSLKKTGSIFVNSKEVFVNYVVKENDRVLVDLDKMAEGKIEKFSDRYKLSDEPISILYEDEYLLIVAKPAGIASHPSSSNYENTLANRVAFYLEKQHIYSIHIVTRLDKDTSGICIFAKNKYVQELFVRKKEKINFYKEYIAVVDGIINAPHSFIEENIIRDENSIITRKISKTEGDYAKTEFFLLKNNLKENYSVLRVILHTGRTHQIRVHFAFSGHILLGDELYAKRLGFQENIRRLIKRQALHARRISFNHPVTNKKLDIVLELPDDIDSLVNN